MAIGGMQRFAYGLFGARAREHKSLEKLKGDISRAQIPVRAEAILSFGWFVGIVTAGVTFLLSLLLVPTFVLKMGLSPVVWMAVVVVPPLAGYIGMIAIVGDPSSKAKKRSKSIDAKLPYATNYISAMASAGVIPAEIFKSLASQHIYGEVAKEAAWIYKDLEVHGKDIVTSLRRAIARSPSTKFQELLQGAITTVTSGGDLTEYFKQKSQRYQWENRVEQKTFVETMGLMAETYVTAAVAGPLFLLVMVAIIVLMGSGKMSQLEMIVYLLLPVINVGFMFGLKSMIPEV